jgi:tyrosyl-tRNA synthetase
MPSALNLLKERGLFAQCSDEKGLDALLQSESVPLYCGFDPTGPSLTVGHLVPVMAMAHLQKLGHRPVALIGGGTCRIGDPTGKSQLRQMLSPEQIKDHSQRFREQLSRFLDFSVGKAQMVDNADWLLKLNYIDMLREVGVHFSVNRMLSFETYKMRWETGLSFIEFNYIILQSFDFMKLNELLGVRLQVGGDDQWGNMVSGIDLTRRMRGQEVFVLTFPLLTSSDGKKMGKTEKGAVYLDASKTSVFDFYQYWRNVHDDDVAKFLKIFTFLQVEEIDSLCAHRDERINNAKALLAFETTKLVHGEAEALKAQAAAQTAFGSSSFDLSAIPNAVLELNRIHSGVPLVDLLVESGLAPSKREARTLIIQGGVSVNDTKVQSPDQHLSAADIRDGSFLLKAGKKRLFRFLVG